MRGRWPGFGSCGITALLAARRHALAAEADVVLERVPPNLLRALSLVGRDRLFTVRPAGGAAP
ncbi:hypothetical protein ACFYNL_35110 [Streptomyces sp. NPDC007808]|uniref:hypothetical protein n=1 Tax=Streptomyces sp. NPDC007808 TaxID=3364779 RepID=UPI0036AE5B82